MNSSALILQRNSSEIRNPRGSELLVAERDLHDPASAADTVVGVYSRWMYRQVLVFAVSAAVFCGFLVPASCARHFNYRPIIGILAQENLDDDPHAQGSSYIAASYVKHVESAGGRVVPIRINHTEEEYERLFNSINGVLLPGGNVDIEKSQFTRVAKIFYELAIKANDASDYFPIWGTCQGFQQLTVLTSNKNLLTLTDTRAVVLPLNFSPGSQNSRFFKRFPKDVLQSLTEENITSNFHSWSLSVQNYSSNAKLKRFYRVLSTNTDGRTEFISTMEAYRYPFYAVQWHPEKSQFEWVEKAGMIHTLSAIKAAFYTAQFFISEAMKNHHRFPSQSEEEKALIYNYQPVFNGLNSIFLQNYYFE